MIYITKAQTRTLTQSMLGRVSLIITIVGCHPPNHNASFQVIYCQTPVFGLGLAGDFTYALDNKNNDNHWNNPHLNFVKGTVLEDKEQGGRIRDTE